MSYNNYMYAIDRSDEYLAHYGIKGMKWGVRKAIETGNSKKLDRAYRKAAKKLAKLEKRANNGSKYVKRAAALGAGAAAAGGLAAVGTRGISNAVKGLGRAATPIGQGLYNIGSKMPRNANGGGFGSGLMKAGNAIKGTRGHIQRFGSSINKWGENNSIGSGVGKAAERFGINNAMRTTNTGTKILSGGIKANPGSKINKAVGGISNNTIARVGAAALGAGLAGAAGYNAYRAATTKRAARKAAEFKSEMNKAFAGTKYANGGGNKSSGNRKRRRR